MNKSSVRPRKSLRESDIVSYDKPVDNDTFNEDMEELREEDKSSPESPSERGSYTVSGSTPDPESDDDVLQNAHDMGIAPDADLEHPKELDLEKDVEKANKYRETH